MQRISTSNRQLNKFGAGKDGWQNGNPATSTDATYGEAEWFDAVQEELANIIESMGIALNPATRTQVRDAIRLMVGGVVGACKNLVISTTGTNASVSVSFDELVLGDATGRRKVVRNQALTINMAGAIGDPLSLSVGPLSANTWYAIHVWDNGVSTTATADPSATAPTAPTGYVGGVSAKAGWIRTDSSGSKFPLGILTNDRSTKYRQAAGSNVSSMPVMASGVAGGTGAFSAVAVGAFVPPSASKIHVSLVGVHSNTSSAVGPNNTYTFGSGATTSAPISNSTTASSVVLASSGQMILESSNIYYYSDTPSSNLCCVGWEDKS